MAKGVPGLPVAIIAAGGILTWSGIYNQSLSNALGSIISGTAPKAGPQTATDVSQTTETSPAGGTITSTGGEPSGSDASNQALGKMMAAAYGWSTGSEWTALNNIVMAESGWSSTVVNPSSGAAGIAQNISGFSSSYQSGNASQQIAWLLSYIKSRYGDPVAAWSFHLANGWY
jgi:hypothetical protein